MSTIAGLYTSLGRLQVLLEREAVVRPISQTKNQESTWNGHGRRTDVSISTHITEASEAFGGQNVTLHGFSKVVSRKTGNLGTGTHISDPRPWSRGFTSIRIGAGSPELSAWNV